MKELQYLCRNIHKIIHYKHYDEYVTKKDGR